jgi:hypothetical protein
MKQPLAAGLWVAEPADVGVVAIAVSVNAVASAALHAMANAR